LRSINNYQIEGIRVIKDQCEVCDQIVHVHHTGHLATHKFPVNGVLKECPGGGLIALRVIRLFRMEYEK
jgi:hypothetical protein